MYEKLLPLFTKINFTTEYIPELNCEFTIEKRLFQLVFVHGSVIVMLLCCNVARTYTLSLTIYLLSVEGWIL